ncbi:TPA: hypothetical protein L5U90_003430 [Pseudomonas aeruginosa]|nr:hypothetical protein [Pseudomonas aeruginosa]
MQSAQIARPQTTGSANPSMRWASRRDLSRWVRAFQVYFPRKAHLAERAAAALAGASSFEQLYGDLPPTADDPDSMDRLYAKRRMVRFREDRLTLIRDFRLLPDAADQFLTSCPVGSQDCLFDGIRDTYYDEALCYYQDDERPSDSIEAVVDQQYQLAVGMRLSTVDSTSRLGEYLPPQMIFDLFNFLRLAFTADLEGSDRIKPSTPITRLGWVTDRELGRLECFALAFTAPPNWCRDEVFYSALAQVSQTRNLNDRPVILLNNLPQQLVRAGHTYTSYGWIVSGAKVFPFLVSHRAMPIADLLVELATFDAGRSSNIADTNNVALGVYWSLLRQHSKASLPEVPEFSSMPDNWMVI